MHRIMQILHDDHINVTRLLDLMEGILEQVQSGSLARVNVACKVMSYMTAYPDLYHHPTEDVVFQHLMMRAAETKPLVEQLFEEHQTIGAAGSDLLGRLKMANVKVSVSPDELVRPGLQYLLLLRDHMNMEEGKIFPLAKVILSSHDWDLLDETIATTRDPLFGEQVQKSYQDLARALTRKN